MNWPSCGTRPAGSRIRSAAERRFSAGQIDRDSLHAQPRRTDQSVEWMASIAAVRDQEGRFLGKLGRAGPEAAQLHLFAVRLPDVAGGLLNGADPHIGNGPRRASGKEEEGGRTGIQQQASWKIVHLCVKDGQAPSHVQGNGVRQSWKGAKVNLACCVIDHEGGLAQDIETDYCVNPDREGFL